jgi:hypothetical protein
MTGPAWDDGPIVFRQSRAKIALLFAVCAAMSDFLGWSIETGQASDPGVSEIGLFLCGLGAVLMLFFFIQPASLTLSAEGLEWKTAFRSRHYRWSDFEEFLLWPKARIFPQPSCRFSQSARKTRPARRLLGGLGSFGGLWERPPAEIVARLNQARTHWGPR